MPNSLTDTAQSADTRLSTSIERARASRDAESYLEQRDRACADRVFSDIARAIDRGLTTLDPRSPDVALLERLRDELRSC